MNMMNGTTLSSNSALVDPRPVNAPGTSSDETRDSRLSESGYTSQENGETSEANNDDFTIITTVEKGPVQIKHNSITPLDNNSDLKEALPNDFTIVTYVENVLQVENSEVNQNSLHSNQCNDSMDSNAACHNNNEVCNGEISDSNNIGLVTSYDVHNCNSIHAPDTEKRHSVVIEGEIVELRASPRLRNSDIVSREPTWRVNQKVVSTAFGFLKDIDGGRDTIVVATTPMADEHDQQQNSIKPDLTFPVTNESSINNECIPVYAKVNKTKAAVLRREPAVVNDYETVVLTSSPGLTSVDNTTGDTEAKVNSVTDSTLGNSDTEEPGELPGTTKLRNHRKHQPSHDAAEDDGGSSDDDKGVYQESFRKSTWLYIGARDEGPKTSDYASLADMDVNKSCEDDSIFGDYLTPTSPRPTHQRNDSTATTVSERDFRTAYNSVSKRYVQRSESQAEYKRMTARFYEHEKVLTLHKDERNSGYGIHILDSQPAVITGVDAGSPAAAAGVKEGQIVVSVNNVNVLEAKHEEILRLVSQKPTQVVLEIGRSDISHLRNQEQLPKLTGWLQKQTSATIFKSWKRRFFILRHDSCLYYYKNEQDTDPLGAIPLCGYVFSRHGDLSRFGFKAEKYSNRTYYFMSNTRADMTRWVGALNESAVRGKDKKDSWMDVTAENVCLPALEVRKPDCSGYICKMGRSSRLWYRRYCVLKDACIYYYKNSSSREAEGVAHLHGYVVESATVSGKKHSFCLKPPEPQMRLFSFYTDNETDKMRWIVALSTSIGKWLKVD